MAHTVIPIKPLKVNYDNLQEQLLERIKDVPLYGRDYRGYPNGVEVVDIISYTNKNGRVVYEGPRGLESNNEYLDELFESHGILSRQTLGKIFWLSTTEPNTSMHDPATGVSTGFQYRVYDDGYEALHFDAIPFATTGNHFDSQHYKLKDQSLKKIVEAMNPNSKLL